MFQLSTIRVIDYMFANEKYNGKIYFHWVTDVVANQCNVIYPKGYRWK